VTGRASEERPAATSEAHPPGRQAAGGGDPAAHGEQPTPDPAPDRLTRTARFAWGAVVVILIGVIGLIVYALTGPPSSSGTVHRVPTSDTVIAEVGRVPARVFDSVGVTATDPLVVPTVLTHQPPLEAAGKPEVLFVGADYCPFCAAERWPLVVALSRFGHFATLYNMQSGQQSVFPGLQTFSFVGAAYSSRYVAFSGVELYSDSIGSDGAYTPIATLTPPQAAVMDRYSSGTGPRGRTGAFPFVDIDNQLVTSTSGFSPGLIVDRSQSAVADALSQLHDPVGQAVVASANYLTAGICLATGQQPAAVCASRGVRSADVALGLHVR